MRDLNFVLRSEIFVYSDRQLQASNLILGCTPVYSTWQSFSKALLVDSPLLSYINVRHANLLPPSLTVGEARNFGPRFVKVGSLEPVRDTSAETVSRNRSIHQPIERPEDPAPIQVAELAAAESVHSSAEFDLGEEEMVTRWVMTIDRFVPGAWPAARTPR